MVLAGRPTVWRDLKCRGRVNSQRDISLSHWQGDEENFSLRVTHPLQFCSKLPYIYYKFISLSTRRRELLLRVYPLPGLDQWEYLFVSRNKKNCQQEEEISFTALHFLSPLNQLVCLLALWGLGSTLPPMVLAGRPTDSWDLKSSTEGSLKNALIF